VLFNTYIVHYGIRQVAKFESKVIVELYRITKFRTTSYHTQANVSCERFNHTLLNMFGTFESEQRKNWKAYVGPLVHVYTCMILLAFHRTIWCSVEYSRLPDGIAFDLRKKFKGSNYITDPIDQLYHIYHLFKPCVDSNRLEISAGKLSIRHFFHLKKRCFIVFMRYMKWRHSSSVAYSNNLKREG
jgi:hypothetical protein